MTHSGDSRRLEPGRGRRLLVTGGAGFIGSHLTRGLLEQGHEVVVLDNLSTGRKENLADVLERITFVEGSITDLDTVLECCQGVDCYMTCVNDVDLTRN